MTREEALKKIQAFIDFFPAAKTEIEEVIDALSKPIWHNANEEQTENNKSIIYQTCYHSMFNIHITFIPTCLRSCKITSYSWNVFVKEVNVKRWAYIDDLLPKKE